MLEHVKAADAEMDETKTRLFQVEKEFKDLQRRHTQQIAALQEGVRRADQDRDQAIQAREKVQQKVLLGQLAYTLSSVIHKVVYEERGLPPTLFDMSSAWTLQEMSAEEHAAWQALMKCFREAGPMTTLSQGDRYLQQLRNPSAHGTSAEAKNTTSSQIEVWASRHCDQAHSSVVKTFIKLLSKFSVPDRPLQIDNERIKAFQKKCQPHEKERAVLARWWRALVKSCCISVALRRYRRL